MPLIPALPEAEAGGSMSLRPAWSTIELQDSQGCTGKLGEREVWERRGEERRERKKRMKGRKSKSQVSRFA